MYNDLSAAEMSEMLNAASGRCLARQHRLDLEQSAQGRAKKNSWQLEPPAHEFRLTLTVGTQEIAMLAEMYLLRLENLMRASEEATRTENARFVPISREAFREDQARSKGKSR